MHLFEIYLWGRLWAGTPTFLQWMGKTYSVGIALSLAEGGGEQPESETVPNSARVSVRWWLTRLLRSLDGSLSSEIRGAIKRASQVGDEDDLDQFSQY